MTTTRAPAVPAPSPRSRRSLTVRLALGVALAASVVVASAASSSAATLASTRPTGPSAATLASPRPPGEVVLGQLTRAPGPTRTTPRAPTSFGPGTTQVLGGSPAARHGAADDLKAGPGCSIACIASGVAYARGPGARLVVETDGTPVFMRILVSGPGYFRSQDSASGVTSFGADFLDLEADTEYQGLVTAWDADGFAQVRVGTFTTLERHVEVRLHDAQLIDRPYGTDEWRAWAWVDGLLVLDDPSPAADGDTVHLPSTVLDTTFDDGLIEVQVELDQADLGAADVCEAPANDWDAPDAGAGDCDRWATASTPDGGIDVDIRPASAGSWTAWTVETVLGLPAPDGLPPGFGQALNFRVPVSLDVTFE